MNKQKPLLGFGPKDSGISETCYYCRKPITDEQQSVLRLQRRRKKKNSGYVMYHKKCVTRKNAAHKRAIPRKVSNFNTVTK